MTQIFRMPYKYRELFETMSDEQRWKLILALFKKDKSKLEWLTLTYYNIIIVDIENIEKQVGIWKKYWKLWWRPKGGGYENEKGGDMKMKRGGIWKWKPKVSKGKVSKGKVSKDKIKENKKEKIEQELAFLLKTRNNVFWEKRIRTNKLFIAYSNLRKEFSFNQIQYWFEKYAKKNIERVKQQIEKWKTETEANRFVEWIRLSILKFITQGNWFISYL